MNARLSPSPQPATGADITDAELDAIYPESHNLGTHYQEIHRTRLRKVIAAATGKQSLPVAQPSADVVVVPREEWAVIEEILTVSAICANEGGTDRKCCMQTDDHYIPLTRLRALRSSTNHDAQDAGEGG